MVHLLTHLQVSGRIGPVNWSRPFFSAITKKNGKKQSCQRDYLCKSIVMESVYNEALVTLQFIVMGSYSFA